MDSVVLFYLNFLCMDYICFNYFLVQWLCADVTIFYLSYLIFIISSFQISVASIDSTTVLHWYFTMDDAFTKPWEDVTEYFRVDPERGLAMEQVRSYQEKYGPNGKKIFNFWNLWGVEILPVKIIFDG